MQIVGGNNMMQAYTDMVELEKEKILKGLAINGIKALPELGSSELLYKIINLMSEYNQKK